MILCFFIESSLMSAQHGVYEVNWSTVTNLIGFTSYVLNCMENGMQVEAISTDFSKAFDKMLRKLAKLGFSGSYLAYIGSYFTGREQFVRDNGSQSRRFSVRSGVP
jgi:hypothetical protein